MYKVKHGLNTVRVVRHTVYYKINVRNNLRLDVLLYNVEYKSRETLETEIIILTFNYRVSFLWRKGVCGNCLRGVHNNAIIMGCVKNCLRLDRFFVTGNIVSQWRYIVA